MKLVRKIGIALCMVDVGLFTMLAITSGKWSGLIFAATMILPAYMLINIKDEDLE